MKFFTTKITEEEFDQSVYESGKYVSKSEHEHIVNYYEKTTTELRSQLDSVQTQLATYKNILNILKSNHEQNNKIFNSVWLKTINE